MSYLKHICIGRLVGMLFLYAVITETMIAFFMPQYRDPFLFDPVIGAREHPGAFTVHVNGITNHKFANSAGFVDDEWDIIKPPGIKRIVLLGDSFVEAWQVPNSEDFETKLEEKFKEAGSAVEVLNFGMRAMGTYQEYATLVTYALRYKPDMIVIVAYLSNDVRDNSSVLDNAPARPYLVFKNGVEQIIPPKDPTHGSLFNFFKQKFHSYRWLVGKYYEARQNFNSSFRKKRPAAAPKSGIPAWFEIYHQKSQQSDAWKEAWNTTKELFRRIDTTAHEHSIPLLVLMIPAHYEIQPETVQVELEERKRKYPDALQELYDLSIPRKKGTEMFGELSVPFIDVYDEFYTRAMRGEELYAPGDNHHVNSDGHEVIADVLYKTIQEQGLLK